MGFTYALVVTTEAVVSYTALPPLPNFLGGSFLLHYPWSRLHRTLSGILPYEARTFLTCGLSALAAATVCLTSILCDSNTLFILRQHHQSNFLHLLLLLQVRRISHSEDVHRDLSPR